MDIIPDYPRGQRWIAPFEKAALLSAEGVRILVDSDIVIRQLHMNFLVQMNDVLATKNIFGFHCVEEIIGTFVDARPSLTEEQDSERLLEICDELVLLRHHILHAAQSTVGVFVSTLLTQAENLQDVSTADARAMIGTDATDEQWQQIRLITELINDIRVGIGKMSPSIDSALQLASIFKRKMRSLHEIIKHKEFDLSVAAQLVEINERNLSR